MFSETKLAREAGIARNTLTRVKRGQRVHVGTRAILEQTVKRLLAERVAQGLPEHVECPDALATIAAVLAGAEEAPAS